MLQHRQELALGMQHDGSSEDIEFDEEADLTPASDLGDADYEPPQTCDAELLSCEEEIDMALESELSESATVSAVRQSSSFNGPVAQKLKVSLTWSPHVLYPVVPLLGRISVGTYGAVSITSGISKSLLSYVSRSL